MRDLYGVGCASVLSLFFVGWASGATHYVNVSNTTPVAPYTSIESASTNIQMAIDAATNGSEILVSPGVYRIHAELRIPGNKGITLRCTQSREAIIDGQQMGRVLSIWGTNTLLEGFTLRNGLTNASYGGGVYVYSACTIRDCLITDNQSWAAGGLFIYASSVLVENCTIQSNVVTHAAGGVWLYNYSTSVLNNCVIRGNVASNFAGGVVLGGAGSLSNTWVSDNQAKQSYGGGISLAQGGRVVNTVVVGNRAQTMGGGIYARKGEVVHCTVVSNTAMGGGGGIQAENLTALNSIFMANSASSNANVEIRTSVFSNCCTSVNLGESNMIGLPAFMNEGARDFRLTAGSICIDSGRSVLGLNRDYAGHVRPVAGTVGGAALYDVGASEYQTGWDAGYTGIGGGWRRLAWFGDYTPMGGAGWIWHNKHGFWYATETSVSSDIWFYTQDMGWLWTSSTTYPFMYRSSDGAWLWYNGATNPRWFRNMTANTWESRP